MVGLYEGRIERLIAARLREQRLKRVEADDVLQEALLRSFRAPGSFEWRGEESFLR